jgi:hypothetical protein
LAIALSATLAGYLPAEAFSDVHKQGVMDIGTYCSVDLDRGEPSALVVLDGDGNEPPQHPTGKGLDFWYQPDGKARYFHPLNGTELAVGGLTAAGFSGCSATNFSKRRLRVDQLPAGTYICERNKAGRLAEIQLKDVDLKHDRLSVAYVTWEK